jgi:hypothetical protein
VPGEAASSALVVAVVAATPGTGTAVVTFTAIAAGELVVPASGQAQGTFTGTAVGQLLPPVQAQGQVVSTFTATATAQVTGPFPAQGQAQATFTATAVGHLGTVASGQVQATFTATATGTQTTPGSGSVQVGFTAIAAGTSAPALLVTPAPGEGTAAPVTLVLNTLVVAVTPSAGEGAGCLLPFSATEDVSVHGLAGEGGKGTPGFRTGARLPGFVIEASTRLLTISVVPEE